MLTFSLLNQKISNVPALDGVLHRLTLLEHGCKNRTSCDNFVSVSRQRVHFSTFIL